MSVADQSFLTEGQTIVHEAEGKLRGLVARAVEDGDYDSVVTITDWAKRMRSIVAGPITGAVLAKQWRANGGEADEYPKYYRADNKLVMIGWSKKMDTDYEHKSPRVVLDQLVPILLESTKDKPIAIKDILPRLKKDNGSEFPEYCVRTFLRWLKDKGLISKNGHAGYFVKNPENFSQPGL